MLLIMNPRGAKAILSSKVKLGADMAAAAGPKGRDAAASTDATLRAEILSYSRSRGLFAGISLEGSTLRPDNNANEKLYGKKITATAIVREWQLLPVPSSAQKMVALLDKRSPKNLSDPKFTEIIPRPLRAAMRFFQDGQAPERARVCQETRWSEELAWQKRSAQFAKNAAPKRFYAPGKRRENLLSVDCGTGREVTMIVPGDCPYLARRAPLGDRTSKITSGGRNRFPRRAGSHRLDSHTASGPLRYRLYRAGVS